MPLPIPTLLLGEMFFDYTVGQLWIGTANGNQLVALGNSAGGGNAGRGVYGLQTATISLTSAQLLALSVTPVQLLPAPGAGLYYWPIAYAMDYTFGGIAYSVTGHTQDCFITYGNPPAAATNELVVYNWASATTGIIDAALSCLFQGVCGNGLVTTSIANNAPLVFSAPNAVTLGNGTLKITLTYLTLPV